MHSGNADRQVTEAVRIEVADLNGVTEAVVAGIALYARAVLAPALAGGHGEARVAARDDREVTFAVDGSADHQVGVAVTVQVARGEAQAVTARGGFRIADLFACQDERGSPLQAARAAEQDVDRPARIGQPALFARDGDREVGVAVAVEVTCGERRSRSGRCLSGLSGRLAWDRN